MPSVENYYYNDTIMKRPNQELYSIKQDKVNQGGEITEWFGSDEYKDKLCDSINVYDKSLNPAVSVDYSFGTYTQDRKSGNAKSPFLVNREGDFRGPFLSYLERDNLIKSYNYYDDITINVEPDFKKFIDLNATCKEENLDYESLKKFIRKHENINVTNKNDAIKNVKNPYDNCIQEWSIKDKYITDKAIQIIETKLNLPKANSNTYNVNVETYIKDHENIQVNNSKQIKGNKSNINIDEANFIKDNPEIFVSDKNKTGIHNKDNIIMNDLKLRDVLDAIGVSKQSIKNTKANIDTSDIKLRDILEAIGVSKGSIKNTKDTIIINDLKLRDKIDVSAFARGQNGKTQDEIVITKEFTNKIPAHDIISKSTILYNNVGNDNLNENLIDLKDRLHDVPINMTINAKPKTQKENYQVELKDSKKQNIYSLRNII